MEKEQRDVERVRNLNDNKDVESAIKFLVDSISETGHNPKPVILHSITVGRLLLDYDYDKSLVIAGFLHDVVEDSDAELKSIESRFGSKVSKLVNCLTIKEDARYDVEKYTEEMKELVKCGKNACIIRVADRVANLPFFHLAQSERLYDWLITKTNIFIKLSEGLLEDEPIYEEFRNEFNEVKEKGY